MLFVADGGEYEHAHGVTFRRFHGGGLRRASPPVSTGNSTSRTFSPRSAETVPRSPRRRREPAPLALAVPALWKGLLYGNLEAASDLAKRFPAEELAGVCELAHRRGLAATFHERPLLDYARQVVEIATAGLPAAERGFLDPVQEVLDRGTSPGSQWIEETQGRSVGLNELLDHFESR